MLRALMSAQHPFRAEVGALFRLALPLSLAMGGQALMGVVDTAVVGRAGAVALAGTGLGSALFIALSVFGWGVMMGLDPLFAQAFGAGDGAGARRLRWQAAWLALFASVALAVPSALAPLLLEPLGIPPDVAREATGYLLWRLPGLPFLLLYFGERGFLQAAGRVRPVLVAALAANVVNVPADLFFVFGGAALPAWAGPLRAMPPMGAAGAAIATSICTALQAGILAWSAGALGGAGARLPPGAWTPRRADLRAALGVGVPIGLHLGAEVGIFSLVGFLAGRLGPIALASHQLALSVASLTFTVALGFGQAGSVRVGWAVGARDREGARRAGLAALACGVGFMAASGAVFLAAPAAIARALTDDPEVVARSVALLRIAALFQVSDGAQGVGAGILRGAGETRFTFTANMLGHWALGAPAALGLGFGLGMGVTGLWWGFTVGLTFVGVALAWRFLRLTSREIVPLREGVAR
jgi:MATE family multidrug resistance protein